MTRGDFRLTAQKYHLTYKTHIDLAKFKKKIKEPWRCLSFVHENGDTNEENPTPYEHTHVAIWFKKKLDIAKTDFFDIEKIHPNIQTKRSAAWFKHVCEVYHKGNKTKKDGKKYFIEPVFIHQEGAEELFTDSEKLNTIINAPSLEEALLETGIMPKSVSDVIAIRKECKRTAETALEEGIDVKRFKTFTYDKSKALVLKGLADCGKTNWAIAQFKNPIMINELDQLRDIKKDTDGLIFDEMLFGHMPKQVQIYLLDMAMDRTIRTRYSNAIIPKKIPRIFVCNEHEWPFGLDPHESVSRRYNVIEINEPMYK